MLRVHQDGERHRLGVGIARIGLRRRRSRSRRDTCTCGAASPAPSWSSMVSSMSSISAGSPASGSLRATPARRPAAGRDDPRRATFRTAMRLPCRRSAASGARHVTRAAPGRAAAPLVVDGRLHAPRRRPSDALHRRRLGRAARGQRAGSRGATRTRRAGDRRSPSRVVRLGVLARAPRGRRAARAADRRHGSASIRRRAGRRRARARGARAARAGAPSARRALVERGRGAGRRRARDARAVRGRPAPASTSACCCWRRARSWRIRRRPRSCVGDGLAAGMARKIPRRGARAARRLRRRLARYAATVPALIPRPFAVLSRAWR